MDTKSLIRVLVRKFHDYAQPAFDSVAKEIDELRAQIKAIPAGRDGEPGIMGPQGAPGDRGEKGDPGDEGKAGLDAYQIAKSLGFQGDVYEWTDSLRGKDGPPGQKGDTGPQGPAGESIEGPPGKDGAPGKDADMDAMRSEMKAMFAEERAEFIRFADDYLSKAVEAMPVPKDGADGKDGMDGVSVTIDDVIPLVKEAVAQIPAPKDGADGRDGAPGADGKDGSSVTVDDVLPLVEKAVAAIPPPRDGIDGKSVTVDDVTPILESMQAKWALEWERRANDVFHAAIDKMPVPKDGADGADGLGFDDIEFIQIDERNGVFRITNGERVKEFPVKIPGIVYRGVYDTGDQYQRGDSTTYGGGLWIAEKDPTGRPGEPESGWRLAAKKGRDGKDADK